MSLHSVISTTSPSRRSTESEVSAVTLSYSTQSECSLRTVEIQHQLAQLQAGFSQPLSSTPLDHAMTEQQYESIEQASVVHSPRESSVFAAPVSDTSREFIHEDARSAADVLPAAAAAAAATSPRPPSHTFSASTLSEDSLHRGNSARTATVTTLVASPANVSSASRRLRSSPLLLLLALTLIALAMYAYTWLCIGSLWDPDGYLTTLPVAIVNNDIGFDPANTLQLNAALIKATQNRTLGQVVQDRMIDNAEVRFRWIIISQKEERAHDAVLRSVRDGRYGAAFYIPANFSRSVARRLQPPSSPAHNLTIEYIHNQGRDFMADALATLAAQKLMLSVTDELQLLIHTNVEVSRVLAASGSPVWLQSLHLQNTTLHPVYRIGQNFACFVQIVILYVACTLIVAMLHRTTYPALRTVATDSGRVHVAAGEYGHQQPAGWWHSQSTAELPPPLPMSLRQVLSRCLIALAAMTVVATLIWSVPVCLPGFQSDGGHPVLSLLWILYTGLVFLCALNLLCMVVGVGLFPVPAFLLLVVLLTTSSAILDDSLVPSFFQIGRGFPIFYAVRGLRFFYFGALADVMWINGLVLFAWTLLPLVISLLVACRRRLAHQPTAPTRLPFK